MSEQPSASVQRKTRATRTPPKDALTRAGAYKVELPWVKNIPLVGWGPFLVRYVRAAGKLDDTRRLHARALVIEDPLGNRVALVSADLHGGSRYVTEKVAAALWDEGFDVANIFLSGTHNHAAPGGLYGSPYFDGFAGSTELLDALLSGTDSQLAFNQELADCIAGKIVEAIRGAVSQLRDAVIGRSSASNGWSRNRSLSAFLNNFPGRTRKEVVAELLQEGLIALAQSDEYLERIAVDSQVHTITAFETSTNMAVIGSFATYGAHCALLGRSHNFQSADFFGEAADRVEEKLTGGKYPGVFALAAGAIGDNDPLQPGVVPSELLEARLHEKENFKLIVQYGAHLAETARTTIEQARSCAHRLTRVKTAFSEEPIADATLADRRKLAATARVGTSTIAGSELGTGDIGCITFSENEGVELRNIPGPHHPKRVNGPYGLDYGAAIPKTIDALSRQHQVLTLRLVELQGASCEDIRLLGIPGEPTTWLTHGLKKLLGESARRVAPMVAGVTGDYHGYLTTSAEYDVQQYEGSSTIWGRETEGWLREQVTKLVSAVEGEPLAPKELVAEFLCDLEDWTNNLDDAQLVGLWRPPTRR